jgi:hypothetical protein
MEWYPNVYWNNEADGEDIAFQKTSYWPPEDEGVCRGEKRIGICGLDGRDGKKCFCVPQVPVESGLKG